MDENDLPVMIAFMAFCLLFPIISIVTIVVAARRHRRRQERSDAV